MTKAQLEEELQHAIKEHAEHIAAAHRAQGAAMQLRALIAQLEKEEQPEADPETAPETA